MSDAPPQHDGDTPEAASDEFAAAFVHHLGRTPVRDLALQAMATLADAAGIRMGLGPEGDAVADLGQARTAIELLRAMVVAADQELGAAATRPFREPLAQLQLAYSKIADANQESRAEHGPGDQSGRLWVPPSGRNE
jgi:hypothetical protein